MHDSLFYHLQKIYLEMDEYPIEWYHGSPSPIESFSDEFVGNGVDQEGPGIYFTSNLDDAYGYARKSEGNGVVYTVQLNFRKLVQVKGNPNKKELLQLIDLSPNLNDILINWDENPLKGKAIALNSFSKEQSPHKAFQSVWYDFYKNDSVEFIRNLVSLGYDGVVVPKQFMNTKHAIVYNSKIIKVVDSI